MPLVKRTPLNLSIGIEQCHNIPKVSIFICTMAYKNNSQLETFQNQVSMAYFPLCFFFHLKYLAFIIFNYFNLWNFTFIILIILIYEKYFTFIIFTYFNLLNFTFIIFNYFNL